MENHSASGSIPVLQLALEITDNLTLSLVSITSTQIFTEEEEKRKDYRWKTNEHFIFKREREMEKKERKINRHEA